MCWVRSFFCEHVWFPLTSAKWLRLVDGAVHNPDPACVGPLQNRQTTINYHRENGGTLPLGWSRTCWKMVAKTLRMVPDLLTKMAACFPFSSSHQLPQTPNFYTTSRVVSKFTACGTGLKNSEDPSQKQVRVRVSNLKATKSSKNL